MNYNIKTSLWWQRNLFSFLILMLGIGCTTNQEGTTSNREKGSTMIEATSLLGDGLIRPDFDEQSMEVLTNELREAINLYDGTPTSMVWIARRTAGLWRFQDAIVVLTDALEEFTGNPHLLRYRAQYLFLIREFAVAQNDLDHIQGNLSDYEDFIEADAPDGSVIEPVSTFHFSVWFYSGLVMYVQGDFSQASIYFERAINAAQNMDAQITATDWLVFSLIQDNKNEQAKAIVQRIPADAHVTDASAYLQRLRMLADTDYIPPIEEYDVFGQITILYGKAIRAKINGDFNTYRSILQEILDTNIWAAISYIAAEAELYRIKVESTT
ncbi:MAG: hypothetical protein JJU41_01635 [Bacteroidetes bacterium]|nr:hypothetical protein [Bacteroidota bacterium]MCH8522956.1 hypothetical protein [Balneolales bacterium]